MNSLPTVAVRRAKSNKPSLAGDKYPSSFKLDSHIFYLFGQIFGHRNTALNRELRRFEVDYSKWRVLAMLNEHPGCSMQLLAQATAVDRTTLAYTVRNMVDQNLVKREERASDRRSVKLALTAQGHKVLQQILPSVIQLNEQCLSGFTKKEIQKIVSQLRRMIRNLTD